MKIALVGTCPSSRMLAMNLPSDWKIWACSPGNDDLPRIDVWFELHNDWDHPCENPSQWGPYFAWINSNRFPVYAQDTRLIPRAKIFPAAELVKEFGDYFFNSQPAWMMAFAISQGAKEIGLFGLDMSARSEYSRQKPCLLHFCWLAGQRGIKVMAPPESEVLMSPPLYGYDKNNPMSRKLRVRELEVKQRLREVEQQYEELRLKRQHFLGVLDDIEYTQQTFCGGLYREEGEVIRMRLVGDKDETDQ